MEAWLCRKCQKAFVEYCEKCPICGGRVKEIAREDEELDPKTSRIELPKKQKK